MERTETEQKRNGGEGVLVTTNVGQITPVSTSKKQKDPLPPKPVIAEKAKEKQATHTEQGYQKSDKAVDTNKELAKVARNLHRVEQMKNFVVPQKSEERYNRLQAVLRAFKAHMDKYPQKP